MSGDLFTPRPGESLVDRCTRAVRVIDHYERCGLTVNMADIRDLLNVVAEHLQESYDSRQVCRERQGQ